MPETTPPTDAQVDESGVVTIVGPYPMPGFEGCTGRNAEHCACATDEIPVCQACEEEIEPGVLAFTATILDLPFLPAGHRDQSETWTSWHAACDQRAARPVPAATHTDDRCLVPVNDYGDECGQRPVFSTVEDQVAQGRVPACAGHTGQVARGRVPDFRDPQPLAAATHTDTAAQAGAQALRDAAGRARSAPATRAGVRLRGEEWADWLESLAAQAPAPTPGQRTVQVVVYTDEPGPDVTEVEGLYDTVQPVVQRVRGGWASGMSGLRTWAHFAGQRSALVPVGTRARLRGDA